jgi:ribonucleoside-diphosphate reductase alpha chain
MGADLSGGGADVGGEPAAHRSRAREPEGVPVSAAQVRSRDYESGFVAGVRFAIGIAGHVAERVARAAETHRSEGAVCALEAFVETLSAEIGATGQAGAASSAPAIAPPVSRDVARVAAKIKGYEGEACPDCANFTLVRNGTCLKCETCGATTGCS